MASSGFPPDARPALPVARLGVTGDLRFEVDGTAGRVEADGGLIRVALDDPLRVARAVGTRGRRGSLAAVSEVLTGSGLTVEVHGPGRLLGSAGSGVDSRVGGLLTGSRAVSVRPAAVLAAVPVAVRTAAGLALAVLAAALWRR